MNEGNVGKPPQPQEFPPLKKEDLEEIYSLFLSLNSKFPYLVPGFEKYIGFESYMEGLEESMGGGDVIINSSGITRPQFLYALAMTRHPLVKEIAKPEFDKSKFDAELLIKNKVMAGIKILDLGSSFVPAFARCCRVMGADVWTADKFPLFAHEQDKRDLEVSRHIQLDLNDKESVNLIIQRSGGNFNLVTEANLYADGFHEGRNIAWPLVKKGGVYNRVSPRDYPELKE